MKKEEKIQKMDSAKMFNIKGHKQDLHKNLDLTLHFPQDKIITEKF